MKVIERRFHGGSERVTYEEFARDVVQDDDYAADIARTMLDAPDEPYEWNETAGHPRFYETFHVLDANELARAWREQQLADDDVCDACGSTGARGGCPNCGAGS